jgi:peptidase YpeB-like protein
MIKLRTASALAVGAVAALAIGGTALAAGTGDPTPGPSVSDDRGVDLLPNGDVSPSAGDSPSAEPSPSATAVPRGSVLAVGIDAAKEIAIRAAGGGRVTSIEQEVEHGRAVWSVDVLAGGVRHDLDVDLATGAVLRHQADGRSAKTARTSAPRATSATHDANDDHGRNRASDDDASDDHGGRGHGGDDDGSDDHGSGGHGSDD